MKKVLLPIILLSAVSLFAQPQRGFGLARLSWDEGLNLTTEQLSKMSQLRNSYQAERINGEASLDISRLKLHQLMRADRTDQKAINATISSIADQRESLQKRWVEHRLEVRTLLTKEQRVLFDARPLGYGPGMNYGRGQGFGDGVGPGRRGRGYRNW
ncbi:MAG: Spy/CpxP family protein refolding chaperone [Candidatus Marinimicrobia bacterium]|nr:Spy/CpxP family protein refolding chaperone [Candidatus Neomarinimicrobiota bacterium]